MRWTSHNVDRCPRPSHLDQNREFLHHMAQGPIIACMEIINVPSQLKSDSLHLSASLSTMHRSSQTNQLRALLVTWKILERQQRIQQVQYSGPLQILLQAKYTKARSILRCEEPFNLQIPLHSHLARGAIKPVIHEKADRLSVEPTLEYLVKHCNDMSDGYCQPFSSSESGLHAYYPPKSLLRPSWLCSGTICNPQYFTYIVFWQ